MRETLVTVPEVYTLPGRYIAVLLELCERQGVSSERMLARSPLGWLDLNASETRVSFAELNWFVNRALQLTQQPALGIQAAAALKLSTHGFFGFAILSSATIADAIDLIEQFVLVQSGPFYFERVQTADEQIMRLQCKESIPETLERVYAEALLLTLVHITEDIAEKPLDGFQILLRAQAPDYYTTECGKLPCPLMYGQSENVVCFPTSFLQSKIRHANQASYQLAKTQCEATLRALVSHDQIENRVRALLSSDLKQPPDLPELARHCHLSTRSLKRKLAERGTGYTSILEEIRKKAAINYFAEQNMPVKEVALRLGFSSTTNFSRAFKKWTGKSPRHFLKTRPN